MPPEAAREETRLLAQRVREGDRQAVSEALNQVDDHRPAERARALDLLDALEGHGQGVRIGVTGAPGAGKSTLLDALVTGLRARDRSVGILAVDPSSRRTGGALLGDRMRLGSSARDAGVFLRSLAARDRLGGLSETTGPSLDVLVAAFDVVFIETVGVGQSESEITQLVDTLIFVAQPAAGDLIQFMKAGILEWPDIFFVNKADLGDAADRTVAELRAGLELGTSQDAVHPQPVLRGSARDGIGIDELIEAIDSHRAHLTASGEGAQRRLRGRHERVSAALLSRYGRNGLERLAASSTDLTAFIDRRTDVSVERIVAEAGFEIEKVLASQGA